MKYKVEYTQDFYNDLAEILHYITHVLKNPQAAERLADKVENAVLKRLEMPLAYEPFNSLKEREHCYYRIFIGNYTVFYVVIDDVMEVRRFIYSKRNIDNIL